MNVSHIFRAYDVRGIYGKDLTEDIMKKIGIAVGILKTGTFTVGRDFRSHSKKLEDALVSGLIKTGCDVTLTGECPIPLCVFANWVLKNNTAAYITASHLTSEWNGVKFFRNDGVGFFEDENKKIGEMVLSENFKISKKKGNIKSAEDLEKCYIDFITERIKPKKIKVVFDFGNGATSLLVPKIAKALNIDAVSVFDKPDPSFPNRSPRPDPEELTVLCKKVVEEKADLGVAYDGDGDRVVFIDDKGNFINTEQSSILFIRNIMKSQKGSVVVNVECSTLIDDEVKKFGQKVIRIPVGHTFLVQSAKKYSSVFAVEKSGHICIPKFLWFDDAIIASMYMIEIVSKLGRKMSEAVEEIPTNYFKMVEIECPDLSKFKIVEKIKKKLMEKYENTNTLDGIRVDFPDSWILIRASNTSPIIRLYLEAKSKEKIDTLAEEYSRMIKNRIEKGG